MNCAKCGKELNDGGYVCLDNFLQFKHYCELEEQVAYCSKNCFADDWLVEWFNAEELEGMRYAN